MGTLSKVESFDAEGMVVLDLVPRRRTRVPWRDVLLLRSQNHALWWFVRGPDGKVKKVPAGRKKQWSAAREAWLAAVEAGTVGAGELTGTCLPPMLETRGDRWLALAWVFVLGPGIFLWRAYTAVWQPLSSLQRWWPEMRGPIIAGAWVAFVLLIVVIGLLWGACVHNLLLARRYRRWRIDRSGLQRQSADDPGSTPISLLGADGRLDPAIPWQSFTTPDVVKRLLAVLLDRVGATFPPPSLRLDVAARLAFVWPVILFAVISLPPLAMGAPEPVTGSLSLSAAWFFGLGAAGAVLAAAAYLAALPKARRDYRDLLDNAGRLRQRLGW